MEKKIFGFIGLGIFVEGVWSELMILDRKEITEDNPFPEIPIEELMSEKENGIIGKIPMYPTEGFNPIEGLIWCDSDYTSKKILSQFRKQFPSLQNEVIHQNIFSELESLLSYES